MIAPLNGKSALALTDCQSEVGSYPPKASVVPADIATSTAREGSMLSTEPTVSTLKVPVLRVHDGQRQNVTLIAHFRVVFAGDQVGASAVGPQQIEGVGDRTISPV